ncbi:hypothetical protein CMV_015530 [Castanea mollissima]|uniref:RNase H type-1 domain-containing protein n=1 Tax=Castanea mollissima TaxID=60419 RepID=A0A8J4QUE0_9ROSI|nr:hypothetical protein CMV_015530 [Castanea mollissima]
MTSYFSTTLFLPNIPWNVAFPIAIWTIWTTRNKFVMENKAFVTSEILKKIQALCIDIFFFLPIKEGKLYRGKANASGLIRNSMGEWVGGFSRHIGITHSMAAELWGLHDGPILAKNLSLRKLIIELDAEPMVTILTSHDALYDSSHPRSALTSLLQSFEVTRIHHLFCERNRVQIFCLTFPAPLYTPPIKICHVFTALIK